MATQECFHLTLKKTVKHRQKDLEMGDQIAVIKKCNPLLQHLEVCTPRLK